MMKSNIGLSILLRFDFNGKGMNKKVQKVAAFNPIKVRF